MHNETLSIYVTIEMGKRRVLSSKIVGSRCLLYIFVILPSSANITYSLSSKLCSVTPPHKIFVPNPLTVTEKIQHTVHDAVRRPCELSYSFVSLSQSNSYTLQQGLNTQLSKIWDCTAQQWIAWVLSHPMLLKSTMWGRKNAIQPAR